MRHLQILTFLACRFIPVRTDMTNIFRPSTEHQKMYDRKMVGSMVSKKLLIVNAIECLNIAGDVYRLTDEP